MSKCLMKSRYVNPKVPLPDDNSDPLKVTNYGLGGLVEDHNDPYGYNEGAPVPPERADLVHSGDIIATVMGEQNVTMSQCHIID